MGGFTTRVTDLTTHQSGFMVASGKNGFMNTDFQTCNGFRHTFHAEYNTAAQQNQVPWAALEGGVLMDEETGHAEGRVNGHPRRGEGPCNANTGVCKGATTEGVTGPRACPSNNFASGQLCEFADGFCVPAGTRTVTLGTNTKAKEVSPVNFCGDNRFQNGDLDFDGIAYRATNWPNGSPKVPQSFRFVGPFDPAGSPYPQIQFESNAPGSASLCDVATGNNCKVPPLGARFYPFWTLTIKTGLGLGHGLFRKGACLWNFGNVIPRVTTRNFGKDAQYGQPDVARFGGTSISAPAPNPEVSGTCPALTLPH